MLDWQVCRWVSPALDLAYFLMTSTNKQLRDKHYDHLIGIYHENLTGIVEACGSRLQRPFRLDDLHEQLRMFGKFGVAMAPLLLQVIVSDPSMISNLDEMAEAAESADADSELASFATFDEESTRNFRQRLGDVIDDAKRLKWI